MGSHDSPRAPPRRRRALAWLAGTIAALLVACAFLFRVYRVDSGSMEPFLHGDAEHGERVLVRYARRPNLARFDTVVILPPGSGEPVVKRVAGLPGELVQLVGGDLVIEGRRLDAAAPRPAPVPLFDSRRTPLEESFQLRGPGWSREGDAWRLEARGGPALESVAAWAAPLYDGRLDAQGRAIDGLTEIGDVVLELELDGLAGPGRFEATLSEEGDRFRLELRLAGERLAASLWRVLPADGDARWASVEVPRPSGALRVRFANLDNHLSVDLGEVRGALAVDYAGNTSLVSVSDRGYRHLRPRVAFGAVDMTLRIGRVRLLRDLHWGARGSHAVAAPLRLGPDEIFVLGDNASASHDSRELGPVPLEAVIGLPVAVVWPPAGWRRL